MMLPDLWSPGHDQLHRLQNTLIVLLWLISLLICDCCFAAVKPRSPQVWNVTVHLEPYQAVIHVGTPYFEDYLTTQKQLFQLHIWTATYNMVACTDWCCLHLVCSPARVFTGFLLMFFVQTQNMSSLDKIVMRIDEAHLKKNTNYQVKVRAIPTESLQGTWSEWSEPYNFSTPPGKRKSINSASEQCDHYNKILSFPSENIQIQILWKKNTFIVCLILILVVTSSVIVSLKHKYDISAHLISKCQWAWDKFYHLIFLFFFSFTELLPMFGQASHILNKHYCRSATQTQYVPFSSLLKQLFFASLTPPHGVLERSEIHHAFPLIFIFAGSLIECQTWCIQRPQSLLRGGNRHGASCGIRTSGGGWCGSVQSSLLLLLTELHECRQRQHRGPGALSSAKQELIWGRGEPPERCSVACRSSRDASVWVGQWGKGDRVRSEQTGGGLRHYVQFLSD